MPKKTEKQLNNLEKNIKNNGSVLPGATAGKTAGDNLPKKRGRPKGSKNSIKTRRPDKAIERSAQVEPGENRNFLLHDMKLSALPEIDINNPEQVKQRINDYFSICADDDIRPSVASLALSFGISRITLFTWLTGKVQRITSKESINTLKKAYDNINSYYEHLMNYGKINPVAGIFLMKNNMGYKDTTDHIITTDNNNNVTDDDIMNKAGLLDE